MNKKLMFLLQVLGIYLFSVEAAHFSKHTDRIAHPYPKKAQKTAMKVKDNPTADAAFHQVTAGGVGSGAEFDLVYKDGNLLFYFDVSLAGGNFICNHFAPATGGVDPTVLSIDFSDYTTRYSSDLEIFVTTATSINQTLADISASVGFGGNEIGTVGTVDTEWPQSYFSSNDPNYPDKCKVYSGPIDIDDGFTTVCIANTCTVSGSFSGGLCPDPEVYVGELTIASYSTTTDAVVSNVNPHCSGVNVPYPVYEINDDGKIEIVTNTDDIWVNFNVTMAGGYYHCLPINPATSTTDGEAHRFTVNYLDQVDNDRYIYDPMIIFSENGLPSQGQYFGGNLEQPLGKTALGFWRDSYSAPHIANVCYGFDGYVNITAGFDGICIMNTCTNGISFNDVYCPEPSIFVGSMILYGFSTTTPVTNPLTTNPVCLANSAPPSTVPTVQPSYEPTCPPLPTCPPIVSQAPVIRPTHYPTHSHNPSTKPTHFPTPVHPPTPTNEPTYCECTCEDGPAPTHYPTHTEEPAAKPTHWPTHTKPYTP